MAPFATLSRSTDARGLAARTKRTPGAQAKRNTLTTPQTLASSLVPSPFPPSVFARNESARESRLSLV
jgi:hypothetical protein